MGLKAQGAGLRACILSRMRRGWGRTLALIFLRSVCWATLLGGGLTALFVGLSAKEVQISSETVWTLFRIMWGLAFVPSLVAELLNAHLGAELRSDNEGH